MGRPIAGAIFDFDGVIIDSARYHEQSWELLAEEEGLTLPPGHFLRGFGWKNTHIIPNILQWSDDTEEIERLGERKEELYRRLMAEGGISLLPGVLHCLEELRRVGIPCVVGSSTPRSNLDAALEQVRVRDFFTTLVAAEDVGRGKPDPEVFLRCAEKIGVPPDQCVVFEDMPVGIEAGRKAGSFVVGVATTHAEDTLLPVADAVVRRLTDLEIVSPAPGVVELVCSPQASS